MGKRANTQAAAAKATRKKAKVEVTVDPAFESVCDAIMEAEELPDRVRKMIVEMLPFSLKFASDERHAVQTMAVDMAEATLNAQQSALRATVANEDGALASLKASESQLGTTVSEVEAGLAVQRAAVQEKSNALAEATEAESASATDLASKRSEHAICQEKVETMQTEKTAIETAFSEHFKPMQEGEAKAHFKKLEPFLKKIKIEATLLTALPSTCAKQHNSRGTFDNLVLQELEKAFSATIAALGDAVAAEGPAAAAREAAIQAAGKDHESKEAAKARAASESATAFFEQSGGEAALSTAKSAVVDFQPQLFEMTARLATAKTALGEFEAGPLANFAAFRTRVAALPAEEAPAEDAPAEEVPVEAASAEAAPAEVAA